MRYGVDVGRGDSGEYESEFLSVTLSVPEEALVWSELAQGVWEYVGAGATLRLYPLPHPRIPFLLAYRAAPRDFFTFYALEPGKESFLTHTLSLPPTVLMQTRTLPRMLITQPQPYIIQGTLEGDVRVQGFFLYADKSHIVAALPYLHLGDGAAGHKGIGVSARTTRLEASYIFHGKHQTAWRCCGDTGAACAFEKLALGRLFTKAEPAPIAAWQELRASAFDFDTYALLLTWEQVHTRATMNFSEIRTGKMRNGEPRFRYERWLQVSATRDDPGSSPGLREANTAYSKRKEKRNSSECPCGSTAFNCVHRLLPRFPPKGYR